MNLTYIFVGDAALAKVEIDSCHFVALTRRLHTAALVGNLVGGVRWQVFQAQRPEIFSLVYFWLCMINEILVWEFSVEQTDSHMPCTLPNSFPFLLFLVYYFGCIL